MTEEAAILLVEDDANDAFFIQRAIKELGFPGRLQWLGNTDEAKLNLAGPNKSAVPDIIVADSSVSMRDSGVEFLEWVRRESAAPNIPFFILSGGVGEETRARAERAGVTKIALKGSNYRELVQHLRELLTALPPGQRAWLK